MADAKGITIPTFDKSCGTQTYDDLQDTIIVNWKLAQIEEYKVKEDAKASERYGYLESEIGKLK